MTRLRVLRFLAEMVNQMGLDLSLKIAMTGLRAVQKGLDTVSSNIANVDTQGYTRKVQTQQSLLAEGKGYGVKTGNIEREVDTALQRAALTEESKVSNLDVKEQYLQQIEMLHGDPDAESSLGNQLAQLSDSFTKLMDSPNSTPLQTQVLSIADNLTRTLNSLSAGVTNVRSNVQSAIHNSLDDLNAQMKTIDDMNRQIKIATSLNRTEPDLEDKRDEAVRVMSQYLDINVARHGDGTIAVLDARGQPLLENGYQPLSAAPSVIGPETSYPGGISAIRQGDPVTGKDITPQLTGGKLGALLELRDRTLPQIQAQFDDLSTTLASQFESAGLTLFTDDTGAVPAPIAPATAVVGFSARIQVSSIVKSEPNRLKDGDTPPSDTTGDSTLLRTIVDDVLGSPHGFNSPPLPGSSELGKFAAEMVSYQTSLRATASAQKESASSVLANLTTKLSDQSGVNVDEEISLLIQLQRSYSSTAQVVSMNNQMFSDLISVLR